MLSLCYKMQVIIVVLIYHKHVQVEVRKHNGSTQVDTTKPAKDALICSHPAH